MSSSLACCEVDRSLCSVNVENIDRVLRFPEFVRNTRIRLRLMGLMFITVASGRVPVLPSLRFSMSLLSLMQKHFCLSRGIMIVCSCSLDGLLMDGSNFLP